jgi:N-formylmaleamate deformylase
MSVQIAGRSVQVRANGLRHHVLQYGEPGRPDLLILPGITSPAATADFLATLIADMGYRVHVPDIRGRGRSDRAAPGHYRLVDYAADVAALIPALGLERPVIVGHSMGARIALAHTALHATGEHGLVVLVDPPVCGPGRGTYPTSRESFLEQLHEAYRGTTAEEVRRFYPKWPQRELQLRAEMLSTCDETAVLETHAGFESEDIIGYWRQLGGPAVLIRGANSPVLPATAAQDLHATNPTIEILAVPDAGHMVPWDNLPGFLHALHPYLQSAQPTNPDQGPFQD